MPHTHTVIGVCVRAPGLQGSPEPEGWGDTAEVLEEVSRSGPVRAQQHVHVHALVDELQSVSRDVLQLVVRRDVRVFLHEVVDLSQPPIIAALFHLLRLNVCA